MKTLEFDARVNEDATLTLPPEIAAEVPGEQAVRVILLVPDDPEGDEWARLTAEQFLAGYADSDAIYDDLPAR